MMRKFFLFLLVMVLVVGNLFSVNIIEKNRSRTWYSNGMYLYEKGEYLKSAECFEKALAIDPDNREAQEMMDRVVKMAMQRKDRGYSAPGKASDYSQPQRSREIVYDSHNSFSLAKNYMRELEGKIRTRFGKREMNFQQLTKYLKHAKGSKEEQEQISEKLKEANADQLNKQGLEYAKRGDFKKAIELFQKAIQQNPYNVQAHINLGLAYAYSDRLYDAIKEYKMVLKLADKNSREYKLALTMIEKLKSFI